MSSPNANARLEMFSDGVFAIAITILILEMKLPPVESIHSNADIWNYLIKLWPSFFALTLTFMIILISWMGHHNLLAGLDKTSPQFQIANGFFLFTVIFLPFPTALMAEYLDSPFAQPAVFLYCLSGTFHNIGWNALHKYIAFPLPLTKSSTNLDLLKRVRRGSQFGFFVSISIVIIAWWFPYIAIVLSFLIWLFWLYLTVDVKDVEAH
jgi:uncharacterized membrane protein